MASAVKAVLVQDEELLTRINRYKQYKQMVEELNVLIENEKVEISSKVVQSGCSSIYVGDFKVTYAPVNKVTLDKDRLKKEMPEVFKAYNTKESSYMQLIVK